MGMHITGNVVVLSRLVIVALSQEHRQSGTQHGRYSYYDAAGTQETLRRLREQRERWQGVGKFHLCDDA
jgi:hypothetical protein